ncbi:MAG: M23 family metallopeptidase, partial [Magnetospirillum sp. WYHS-4]
EERLADFRRGLDEIARGWDARRALADGDGGRQSPPTTEPRDGDGITYGRKPDGRPYASGPVPPPAMPEATEVRQVPDARRPIAPGPSGTLPPVDFPKIRVDDEGDGNFRSRRAHGDHMGLDLEVPPGDPVKSPVEGQVERMGSTYKKEADPFGGKYQTIWIRGLDGNLYGLGYAVPMDKGGREIVKPGDRVAAGQVVGSMQNRAEEVKSGLMKNHMHFSIFGKDGKEIDPTPLFREWTRAFSELD